jgi:primosomal protein N' (replication factor Y)
MKCAQVIVDNRASKVDRPFTYSVGIHADLIEEGMRVVVPFGKGNKPIKGFVLQIIDIESTEHELKEIIDILDDKPIATRELMEIGLWMKKRYLSPYIDALQPILPPGDYKEINTFVELLDTKYDNLSHEGYMVVSYLERNGISLLDKIKDELKIPKINNIIKSLEDDKIINTIIDIKTSITKKYEKWIIVNSNNYEEAVKLIGNRSKKQIEIYKYLFEMREIELNKLIENLNTTLSTIRSLEEKGIIKIIEKEVERTPINKIIPTYKKLRFNYEQYLAYSKILESIDGNSKDNFLIHGVTGSGKTEIYLQLVEEMLKRNKDIIVLVPEISLTPQTIDRFVGRFGENVAVLHSKLSQGERFDQWRSIKEGKVKIVVGARSAIFAPFNNLGLILIDEEHEDTYKSSQNPKYDTIEVALKRCELEDSILVMGSATPSVETYYHTLNGKFKLLELKNRATKNTLPEVVLVDMRDELQQGNRSIFSTILYEELKKNLENNKQSILFLNRRGFSTFISCRSCGYVVKCDNCDISMTYHRNINKLRCHYCGVTETPPQVCPKCNSKYIKYFGIGTEKVEEQVREYFPEARVVRMDSDTTALKGSFENILEEMKNNKIDILIGTQMISKGLDFPNVTLVGIIAADTTLNLPDYRSPEKAFQLITQVAGRSGRGDLTGKVVLQTYSPDHYSIICSESQDYKSFYDIEINLRKEFLYPPFINLISIIVYGENLNSVKEKTSALYDIIKMYMINIHMEDLEEFLIGPNPAPIEKIKNNYRWQILIKANDLNLEGLKALINRVCILDEFNIKNNGIKFGIDINPHTIL